MIYFCCVQYPFAAEGLVPYWALLFIRERIVEPMVSAAHLKSLI
jgi:hypothetical protein